MKPITIDIAGRPASYVSAAVLDNGCEHGPVRWLQDIATHDLPTRPGVYVFLAGPHTQFMYPRRSSSVFYIGQASDLRRRLYKHAQFAMFAEHYHAWPIANSVGGWNSLRSAKQLAGLRDA